MDEKAMVAACREGEADAFRNLVVGYGNLVLAVAINVLGNREDAEDAAQETFLQVFRNIESYDPERSFKTWLLTILYRRCLDMIKKRRRFSAFAVRARHELVEGSYATGNPRPEDPEPLPSSLLKALSPKERTALCLWANEGFTAADISDVLECSASTARVHLFNARKKIKSLLEKNHGVLQPH